MRPRKDRQTKVDCRRVERIHRVGEIETQILIDVQSSRLDDQPHPSGYSLSEREIAVIINSKWHSAYPTNAHERPGKKVGLPPERVEAMPSGLPTSFADEREQIVYEMVICLGNSRWVSKGLYDRAVKALGRVGITDAITLMGYYTSVSMTTRLTGRRTSGNACAATTSGSRFRALALPDRCA
jgi:hypothetical protein